MRIRHLTLLALTAMPAAPALAQGRDLVVMRKVMPELEAPNFPGKWKAGDWTWSAGSQSCTDAAIQTRAYFCTQDGAVVPASRCKGTAPQTEERGGPRYEGCSYSWTRTGQSAWDKACSDTATRTIVYECRRGGGDAAPVTVADSLCGAKPETAEKSSNYEGCTYEWRPSGYGGWASTCSDSTTRNVTYACRRTGGDALPVDVEGAKCGKAPSATETAANYAGCTYAWARKSSGAWSGDKCLATSTRTIEWGCQRSGGQSATTFVPADQEFMCGKNTQPTSEKGGSCAIVNGDFEGAYIVAGDATIGKWTSRGNGNGWTDYGVTGYGGYLRISAGAGGYNRQFLEQTVRMTAGTVYRISFSYKTKGNTDPSGFAVYNFSVNLPRSTAWTTVSYDIKSPGTANPVLYFFVNNINYPSSMSELWVDNVTMDIIG